METSVLRMDGERLRSRVDVLRCCPIRPLEHAHELGLLYQGQAKHGLRAPLVKVVILGKTILDRGVIQNHTLLGAGNITQDRFWQRGPGHGPFSHIDYNRVAAGSGLDSIRYSSSRGIINNPRSAPACSIAVRMSVSTSFSRMISPERAWDTLIRVARSS